MKKVRTKRLCYVGVVFGIIGCFLAAIFASARVSADETVTSEASVTVTSTCRLSAVIDTAHQASVPAGTYQDNIGKTTISAQCNDVNGFDVYAVGYTNTEFGRNDMLGAATGRTVDTGTATSGNTSNWAMKLSSVSGAVSPTILSDFDDYHGVPDDYTKVATYSDTTMSVGVGSQFETTYAMYASGAQLPDTYNSKVKYTLVHPSDSPSAPCGVTYTILYNSNGGSGNMDSQTGCVDSAVGLLPSGFTPPAPIAENQFVVWNTEPDGSGHFYRARQSVTNLASAGGSITLYAMWAPKYMQDLTAEMCSMVATENPFTVYDRRDGSDYTVRYLAGACWMTQNLRITGVINQEYSDFTRVENFDPCVSDLTSGNDVTEPRCHDSGDSTYGVWYNYSAASAGQIVGTNNSTKATQSICPKNWSLPGYDANGSVGTIKSIVNSASGFDPVAGGRYTGGSISQAALGFWWSTTWGTSANRYALYYNSTSGVIDAGNSGSYRYCGQFIRCVRVPESD